MSPRRSRRSRFVAVAGVRRGADSTSAGSASFTLRVRPAHKWMMGTEAPGFLLRGAPDRIAALVPIVAGWLSPRRRFCEFPPSRAPVHLRYDFGPSESALTSSRPENLSARLVSPRSRRRSKSPSLEIGFLYLIRGHRGDLRARLALATTRLEGLGLVERVLPPACGAMASSVAATISCILSARAAARCSCRAQRSARPRAPPPPVHPSRTTLVRLLDETSQLRAPIPGRRALARVCLLARGPLTRASALIALDDDVIAVSSRRERTASDAASPSRDA
jgi:hypothetical protein